MFNLEMVPLSAEVLLGALLIFGLRLGDVSLGTMRMIMITRGMKKWAALTGFVEVTIWVVAISQVFSNLNNIWSILAYSGGFASGTLLGMWIEGRIALGYVDVHVISIEKGGQLAQRIRNAGYGVTELQAVGQSGPVHVLDIVVLRKQLTRLMRLINRVDPDSFVTIDETREVLRGYQRLGK